MRYTLFVLSLTLAITLVVTPRPAEADVVVAELFNDRLVRYDEVTGEVISDWGIAAGAAGLVEPSGVTVSPDGDALFVSSRLTGEVLWYSAVTGLPLPSPQAGGRDGLFATLPLNPPVDQGGAPTQGSPAALRFGPDGNLYVSDFGGQNVRIFDGMNGAFLGNAAEGLNGAGGVVFLENRDLLAADFNLGAIYRIDDQGQQLLVPSGTGGLQTPNSMLISTSGDILVADLFGNQIMAFHPDGSTAEQFIVIPPDIPDPLPPGAFVPSNFPSDLLILPGQPDQVDALLLIGVLGITNPDAGGADNGALLRYDFGGNFVEPVAEGISPVAAMVLVPAVQTLVGDYDRNGSIGPEDYNLWKSQYRQRVALGSGADGTVDAIVTAADYTIWRNALQSGAGSGFQSQRVPEPLSAIQIGLALASLIGVRWRIPCCRKSGCYHGISATAA